MDFNGWILSILGVIFLNVFSNLILSDSSLNDWIKKIFALCGVIIILSPILKLTNIDFENYLKETNFNIDEQFISDFNDKKLFNLENLIVNELKKEGFLNVNVTFDTYLSNNELEIKKVYLDLSNLVINSISQHINKYNKIKEIVIIITGLDEEKIVLNE